MSSGRRYRSTLRKGQAKETRQRILDGARRLFEQDGFSETTINRIAQEAGVAPQTVYAVFGNKGTIVVELIGELEREAGMGTWVTRILAAPEPIGQLRVFASWIRTFFEQIAPLLRAAAAARGDPDVAALAERGDANRLRGATRLTQGWAQRGALRDGLSARAAAQVLWLLTSVEQYLLAIDGLGWTPDRYERWLGDVLERELLEPGGPSGPSG